jgi:hypothetical protein
MRWIHSGLQGISHWLTTRPQPVMASAEHMDSIREAMLEILGEAGTRQWPRLATRIRYCRELDTLWALRGELMDACSKLHGEMHARRMLARVTDRFEGLLPHATGSRIGRNRAEPLAGRRY